MWFLNKKTGIRWDITDEQLVKRLKADPNYEIVKNSGTLKAKTAEEKVE